MRDNWILVTTHFLTLLIVTLVTAREFMNIFDPNDILRQFDIIMVILLYALVGLQSSFVVVDALNNRKSLVMALLLGVYLLILALGLPVSIFVRAYVTLPGNVSDSEVNNVVFTAKMFGMLASGLATALE